MPHTTAERIEETKENGVLIECAILGDINDEDNLPYYEIHKLYPTAYTHVDPKDIDNIAKKVKVWVSKTRTPKATVDNVKAQFSVVNETTLTP